MNFLIDPKYNGSWVSTNRELSREELSDLVLGNDVVIADLDDCILPSPAKRLAFEELKDIRSYLNIDYVLWRLETAIALIKSGRSSETECWKEYVELFLQSHEQRQKAKQKINKLLEEGKLKEYPGAAEFFSLVLRDNESYLLTRNIPEITEIFKEKYRFGFALSQVWNKQALSAVFAISSRKKYLIVGDSAGIADPIPD